VLGGVVLEFVGDGGIDGVVVAGGALGGAGEAGAGDVFVVVVGGGGANAAVYVVGLAEAGGEGAGAVAMAALAGDAAAAGPEFAAGHGAEGGDLGTGAVTVDVGALAGGDDFTGAGAGVVFEGVDVECRTGDGGVVGEGADGFDVTGGALEAGAGAEEGAGCTRVYVDAVPVGVDDVAMGGVAAMAAAAVELTAPLGGNEGCSAGAV